MKITVITLFPNMIGAFLNESIVKRAQEKGLVEIEIVNLRDFAKDKHKTVDDKPYGGGAGMVLMVEPIVDAIASVSSRTLKEGEGSHKNEISPSPLAGRNDRAGLKQKIILTSPRGKVYVQKTAQEFSKLDHLIIIAGHYEGVDARVLNHVDEEVSIGDFVMTGGEIAVAAIIDSVVRLLPGVLKKMEATVEESFFTVSVEKLIDAVGQNEVLENLKRKGTKSVKLLEYPHFTRPEVYDGTSVPEILMSGNHAAIEKWRLRQAFEITRVRRPDLLDKLA